MPRVHPFWPRGAHDLSRRSLVGAATVLMAAGAVAAWCVVAATSALGPATPEASTPATTPSASSAAPAPPATEDRITLAFGGDIHFENHVRRLLTTPSALAPLRKTLGAADFAMVNLETAITSGRRSPVAKRFTFSAPPIALSALQSIGVDAVSMANNHAADFGQAGLRDTLAARASGTLPMVGVGTNAADAFTPTVVTVEGVRVALLASLQLREETSQGYAATDDTPGVATNLTMTRLRAAVRSAAARSDVVVVFMHWGTEYTECADSWQRRTARALEADGADLIVGGHAHRLQGAGWFGRSYVAYGLGNFVWWKSSEPDSRTGVLTVTVDATAARARGAARGAARRTASSLVTGATWTPMLVGKDGVPTVPADPRDTARLRNVWGSAVACSGLSSTPH